MPLSADTPPTARSPVFALCAACVLLLGFAAGGLWSANQVTMVPSAVPASMAVEGHNQRNALAANAHAQLRLSASGPRWREISEPQRQVLMPLRDRWDTIGALAKRRWLVLADRYPSMDESERNKLVSRMNTWASLSAQQRNQARINFESVKRLSAQELQSKWDEYQALSAAEKNRLAEQARKAKTAKKSKQRKLAQVPARGKAAPAAPAVAPPAAEVTTRPVATPAFVEALPVSTPQAAPSVHLTPLERKPQVATQPVAIPQATPSVELPPLPPVLHPEVTGTPHMRPLTDTHQPTHPVLPTAPTQIAPSPAQ